MPRGGGEAGTGDDVTSGLDGVVVLDADLRYRSVDAGAASLLGAESPALVGERFGDVVCTTPDSLRRTLRVATETGRPEAFACESRRDARRLDGWAVPEGDGLALYLVADDRERTADRERATDGECTTDPERTDALLQHAESLARTGGWEFDLTTETLFWTDGTRRIHGVDDDYRPTVEDALSFYHPEDRSEVESAVERAITDRESYDIESRLHTRGGQVRWIRTVGEPVVVDDRVTAVRGAIRDVTEQKAVEKRLRQFERAAEHAGHAIYVTDVDGTITYVNESFEDLTGYRSQEVVGKTPRVLNSGEMPSEYFEELWAAILDGRTFEEHIIDQDASGRRYHAHQTIAPIEDDDGEITGFVAVQTDVTDRIEREQQVAVLDRILRHNLRNDMTVVLGHADLLRERTSGDLAESAETIHAIGSRLVDLAEKERSMVQLLANDSSVESFDVGQQIACAVERAREQHPEAEISASYPDDLSVDATRRIDDALFELLENAVVHTDHDDPVAEVSVESAADTVTITVADRGPGVDSFEEQLISAVELPDSLYHGEGIGLWLVNWIVTQSGGTVNFESREPRGTAVHVRLPRSEE
jgi:PAS domain S-box-containing protein